MGNFCKVCVSTKPSEQFTGKGRKVKICKKCAALPQSKREDILNLQELYDFWMQSNISKRNIKRIRNLELQSNLEVCKLARVLLKVAIDFPCKRKRLKKIAKSKPELMRELSDIGLLFGYSDEPIYEADELYIVDYYSQCADLEDQYSEWVLSWQHLTNN